jgi:hypothetical protein
MSRGDYRGQQGVARTCPLRGHAACRPAGSESASHPSIRARFIAPFFPTRAMPPVGVSARACSGEGVIRQPDTPQVQFRQTRGGHRLIRWS